MINLGGAYGSNTEMAFSLFEATLEESTSPLGCNNGLIRDYADSFSLDCQMSPINPLLTGRPTWTFEDVHKPGTEQVIVGGFGGDYPSGCTNSQGHSNEPYTGILGQASPDGPFFSICSSDYLSGLEFHH